MIICRLLSPFLKIKPSLIGSLDYSQDITKNFQGQLTVPSHEQTLLRNAFMEEKYFTFFLRRNIVDN